MINNIDLTDDEMALLDDALSFMYQHRNYSMVDTKNQTWQLGKKFTAMVDAIENTK